MWMWITATVFDARSNILKEIASQNGVTAQSTLPIFKFFKDGSRVANILKADKALIEDALKRFQGPRDQGHWDV
jgi:hypothetical protein